MMPLFLNFLYASYAFSRFSLEVLLSKYLSIFVNSGPFFIGGTLRPSHPSIQVSLNFFSFKIGHLNRCPTTSLAMMHMASLSVLSFTLSPCFNPGCNFKHVTTTYRRKDGSTNVGGVKLVYKVTGPTHFDVLITLLHSSVYASTYASRGLHSSSPPLHCAPSSVISISSMMLPQVYKTCIHLCNPFFRLALSAWISRVATRDIASSCSSLMHLSAICVSNPTVETIR